MTQLIDANVYETETARRAPEAMLHGQLNGPMRPGAFTLLCTSTDGALQVFRLAPGEVKVIGRASPADLVMDDRSLSRVHARLTWLPDGIHVEDLRSKNGTRLDDQSIVSMSLRADRAQQLWLGNVQLTVRSEQNAATPGFDAREHFLDRVDEELRRAGAFGRTLSLLMLRALGSELDVQVAQRIRKELRSVDSITLYAPGVLLILAPEQALAQTLLAARWLVRERSGEQQLVCGVASSEQSAAGTTQALVAAVSGACRTATQSEPVVAAATDPCEPPASETPVLLSPRMITLYKTGARVASHMAPVLIVGETGTGKELVARHIHASGLRHDKPFVALNCAAIPRDLVETTLFGHERGAFSGASEERRGVFEEADGGTLFLDEIGELPLSAQAALLRVLETKQLTRVGSARAVEVDVRVISATHCDLEGMVHTRCFRADLYHRLNVLIMSVPPLRERPEEIAALAQHFVSLLRRGTPGEQALLPAEVIERLQRYSWPGNVRELRNVIERAVLMCTGPEVTVFDLPRSLTAAAVPSTDGARATPDNGSHFADQLRNLEVELIRDALRRSGNNQTQASRLLNMPLRTLVYKIRAYGLRRAVGD
jgi:two-component system response regulator AtoC